MKGAPKQPDLIPSRIRLARAILAETGPLTMFQVMVEFRKRGNRATRAVVQRALQIGRTEGLLEMRALPWRSGVMGRRHVWALPEDGGGN